MQCQSEGVHCIHHELHFTLLLVSATQEFAVAGKLITQFGRSSILKRRKLGSRNAPLVKKKIIIYFQRESRHVSVFSAETAPKAFPRLFPFSRRDCFMGHSIKVVVITENGDGAVPS
jgi:hypothetical protein